MHSYHKQPLGIARKAMLVLSAEWLPISLHLNNILTIKIMFSHQLPNTQIPVCYCSLWGLPFWLLTYLLHFLF